MLQNFFEGAMRGAMASLRGYAEAKVAVAQARNQSELQKANSRLAQAQQDILRRRNEIDLQLGESQLKTQQDITKAEQAGQTKRVELTIGGQQYMAELDDKGQTTRTWMATEADKEIAKTGAESAENVATIGAEAGKEQAQITADAQVKSAEAGAKAQTDAAQMDYDKALKVAELQGQALQGVADVERQSELDKLFYEKLGDGAAGGTISVEASRHFMSVLGAVRQTDAYKLLNASQSAAQRVLALYADGGTPEKDIAFMNIFQRVIDPGVSVREGDVHLQQSTMPYVQQIQATIQRIEEGVVLTPEMRQGMVEALMALANADYDLLLPVVQQSVGDQLSQNAELVQTGRNTPDSLFYVPLQRFEGTPTIDEGTGGVSMQTPEQAQQQTANTATGDGRMQRGPQTEPAGGTGAESRVMALVQRANEQMAKGKSGQEVRQALIGTLERKVSDPAKRQALLEAVDSQVDWGIDDTGQSRIHPSMNKLRR